MARLRQPWALLAPVLIVRLVVASLLSLAVGTLAGCSTEPERAAPTRSPAAPAAPASGPRATVRLDAEDGQWTRPTKDYAATRYSQLTEITTENAGRLVPVWSYSMGVLRGHEEAPLVVGSTMYLVTSFPNELHALDLTRQGAIKWIYRPRPDDDHGPARREGARARRQLGG